MLLRWRALPPEFTTRWRMPEGLLDAVRVNPQTPLAGFLVPPNDVVALTEGDGIDIVGAEIRMDINSLPSAP